MKCKHVWNTTSVVDGVTGKSRLAATFCKPCGIPGTRVLVCRVGRRAVIEGIPKGSNNGSERLDAMQSLVGGLVEVVVLDDGVEAWLNEEGMLLDLPLNRIIQAAPRPEPMLFGEPVEVIYADDGLARPGEPGVWAFRGDFFLSRTDDEGELADLDDESIKKYTELFESEDIHAAHRMNELRARMEQRR